MSHASSCLRSLSVAGALCAAWLALAPVARADAQSSCTLRVSLDIFSKPKGQGRRMRLSAGTVLEILGHNGNWYTVYTGTAEAYVPASAYARACAPTARPTPKPKLPAELIDIPLEPLPGVPAAPSNPTPMLPSVQDLKDKEATPPPPPPVAPVPPLTRAAPPPVQIAPRRVELTPPSSSFEPPSPLVEMPVASIERWKQVEVGLWIGGGVLLATSAALLTADLVIFSHASDDVDRYKRGGEVDTQNYNNILDEAKTVKTLNVLYVVTGVAGGAALATALGLHFWGPQATETAEPNPMAALPPMRLRFGWRSFALEGHF